MSLPPFHRRPRSSNSLLLSLLLLAICMYSSKAQSQPPTLLWSDEFEGAGISPDPNVWSYDLGMGGFGNGELQTYTSMTENVRVQDGLLTITARMDNSTGTPVFTSGRIKTEARMSFTYGTLEARIKVPDMDAGLWPAFWTLGSNYYLTGWPNAGEVDIMEMGQGLAIEEGVVNRRVVSAAHWDLMGEYATYARSYDAPMDLNDDFHIYRLEWTPETMTTYVDGNWIWEMDINSSVCPSCEELHQSHFVLFNMAVGGGFTSGSSSSSSAGSSSSSGCASSAAGSSSSGGCLGRTPDEITAPLPGDLLVDWVRLYDNGFTEVDLPPTPAPSPSPPTLTPVITPTEPPVAETQQTAAPTTAPVTASPRTPAPFVTNAPRQPDPVLPVSPGGSSKGGSKLGSVSDGGSRSVSGGSKGGKGSKGGSAFGSRQGVSGGKGKGKSQSSSIRAATGGSKGKGKAKRWSRSGATATGAFSGDETATSTSTTTTTTTATSGGTSSPATSGSDRDTTTDSNTASGSGVGTGFGPADGGQGGTDSDGDRTVVGPSSLIVEPSRSAAIASSWIISSAMSSLVTLGLIVSSATFTA